MADTNAHTRRDRVEQLADEFARRYRGGENPSIEEYAARYPELAGEIRQVFETLLVMERLKPQSRDASGALRVGVKPGPLVQPDQQIGDYRILREVGHGGMGVVYEAEQISLGRHVALKVLHAAALRDARSVARFQREARAAAHLHHTNIVPVFGVGHQDNVHYYAMQFIQGQALDDVLAELKWLRKKDSGEQHGETRCRIAASPRSRPLARESAARLASGLLSGEFARAGHEPDVTDSAAPSIQARSGNGMGSGVAVALPTGSQDGLAVSRDKASGDNSLSANGQAEDASIGSRGGVNDAAETEVSTASTSVLPGQTEKSPIIQSAHTYWHSVARIGMQVADALQYAHDQDILHRDIKPANLLLDRFGNTWVTDFGLAKAESDEDLTESGDVLGTLRYMSPEALQGEADARSDIYCLGLTLYELITHSPAFDATHHSALFRQVTEGEVAPFRKHDTASPRDLETIVMKALERAPAGRYQSARDMAEDLERFLEDKPIRARRTGPIERLWRWSKRNPAVASLCAAVSLLVVVVTIGSMVAAEVFRRQRDTVVSQKQDLEKAREQLEAERIRKDRALWSSYLDQARALRATNLPGRRFDSFEAVAKAANLVPGLESDAHDVLRLRNEAIACMGVIGDLRVIRSQRFPNFAWHTAFDRALMRYARPDGRGGVVIRAVDDNRELLRLPRLGTRAGYVAFSPDESLFAVVYENRGRELRVWRLRDLTSVFQSRLVNVDSRTISFSPDGKSLGVIHEDRTVGVYDLESGNQISSLPERTRPYSLCFHPNGRVLSIANDTDVEIWDVEARKLLKSFRHPKWVASIAWRGDGRFLAAGSDDHRVYVWNAETGRQHRILTGHSGLTVHIAFSHRGDLLATNAWDATTRLWDVATGSQILRAAARRLIRFSQDDSRLAFNDNQEVGVWEVAPGEEIRRFAVSNDTTRPAHSADISSNGRVMAVAATDGVQLWDLSQGSLVATLSIGDTRSALFLPDDAALITCGKEGIRRWPMTWQPGVLRIASPVLRRRLNRGTTFAQLTADGRFLMVADTSRKAILVDLDSDAEPIDFDGHVNVTAVSISPRREWAATGTQHGKGIWVWDATKGTRIRDLWPENQEFGWVAFSPDGRWLAARGLSEARLWMTESWQLMWRIPTDGGERSLFSPDGRFLAFNPSQNEVRLVDVQTGRELATLQAPEIGFAGCFSSDGTSLATMSGSLIRVWDLRLIRRRLARLGLDWDAPSYPELTSPNPPSPFRVEVEHLEISREAAQRRSERADRYARGGQWEKAADELIMAIESDPTHHWYWYRLTALLAQLNDVERYTEHRRQMLARFGQTKDPTIAERIAKASLILPAQGEELRVANQLAQLAVTNENSWRQFAMGLVEYRNNEFERAVAWLRLACVEGDAYRRALAHCVLAMAYHQLGSIEDARRFLDAAAQIVDTQLPKLEAGDLGGSWPDWLHVHIARREAVTMISETVESAGGDEDGNTGKE